MVKVELRPHKGVMNSPLGPIEVEHNQYVIMANGLQVGYIGKDPGSPLNFILNLPESITKAIKNEVFAQLGWISPVSIPPSDEEVQEHLESIDSSDSEEDDL